MSWTLFCSKEETQKTIMVHGYHSSKFMNSCGESKFLWLLDVCGVMEKTPGGGSRYHSIASRAAAFGVGDLQPAVLRGPCRAGHTSHHECFFSRLVRSNITETPAEMENPFLILKLESFLFVRSSKNRPLGMRWFTEDSPEICISSFCKANFFKKLMPDEDRQVHLKLRTCEMIWVGSHMKPSLPRNQPMLPSFWGATVDIVLLDFIFYSSLVNEHAIRMQSKHLQKTPCPQKPFG